MRKALCLITLLLIFSPCKAQNLVPNGNFEQHIVCPTAPGMFWAASPWINPTSSSPDYLNACNNPGLMGIPNNVYGSQQAHSGTGYGGMVPWAGFFLTDYREYFEVHLSSTLTANTCYHFEMFVSLAEESKYTSDAMGVYFSDTVVQGITNMLILPFTPQININMGLITDTLQWFPITGDFTATGTENYIIIGSFVPDLLTNYSYLPWGFENYPIYYIDDISLTPCTGLDDENVNIEIINKPNPFSDHWEIKTNTNLPAEVTLYDLAARKILYKQFTGSLKLNTESLAEGTYIYQIKQKNGTTKMGKVIKN